jgi:NAD-dependent dihydropyrimidine dehydrogenase PreA subunit
MMGLGSLMMGTFMRWSGHRTEPGLRKVGNPDADSPVLVTCNYSLTVARVLRAVRGRDLWLLVAPSGGINVWCAACGGEFTDHQVVSAIKTSGLGDRVTHRRIWLPALSAPGMNRTSIEEQTGFRPRFGPASARDIPAWIDAKFELTDAMKRADFSARHRLDMLVSMNTVYYLPLAVLFAIFWREHLLHLTALFWGLALATYLAVPWIPGRTGWAKSLVVTALAAGGYGLAGHLTAGDALAMWPWMLGSAGLMALIGLDLGGTTSPMHSDGEALMHALGIKSMGSFMKEKNMGRVQLDTAKCTGCGTCNDVCPIGVFDFDDDAHKTRPARAADCFSCAACTRQCPVDALTLRA